VRLPLTAVAEAKGQTVVWVLDPGAMTVRTQAVKVVGADGNSVLIAQGVRPGDEVVVAGVHTLTPGQKVKRYAEPTAAAAPAASTPTAASAPSTAASR
jgi:multidrug efflux pump subunit AcrA (membrane-fusion protein)